MRRKIWIACMIYCLAALLTGCFGGERGFDSLDRNKHPIFHEPEEVTLKVYASKPAWEQFVERYGLQLEENFKHIELQHVETPSFNNTEDTEVNKRLEHEYIIREWEIDLILGGYIRSGRMKSF